VAVPSDPGPELAPVVVAEALGEFDAERLDVTTVPLDDEEAMAALDAGEVDVVVGPIGGGYLDALDAGSGARLALGGVLSRAPNDLAEGQAGLWVRTDAVTSGDLGDLALQPVAAPGGVQAAAAYPLNLVMNQTDATLNDVALRDAGGPDAASALLAGELAAAWLDGNAWPRVAGEGGAHLAATLPASESIDGTVVSPRLLGPDRAVGVAYVRAILRTINTHLTGDYTDDDEVMAAIAEGTGLDPGTLGVAGAQLFDWEVRDGTVGRIQEALVLIGGVAYDEPLPADRFVDRTLAAEAVG
jgi:NitT/TauT family transport system substrate-binding protein